MTTFLFDLVAFGTVAVGCVVVTCLLLAGVITLIDLAGDAIRER